MKSTHHLRCVALCLLGTAVPAYAQFDPAKVLREPPAVAARFPDPAVSYPTPSLRPDRTDFASHAEVLAFLDETAKAAGGRVQIETIGHSQKGLPVPLAVLTASGRPDPALPTVMVIAQQHGNEPASGEAALALVQQLAGPKAALLSRVNVLVVPRGNADGAERFARATANGIDVNRDHLLLRTPEARAIAAATLKYAPQVVLDLHEFTVAGRWVDKFGAMQKYDALVQPATVGNLNPQIAATAQRGHVDRITAAWTRAGLNSFAYHTTSPDPRDPVVSMGGVQADTGRNTSGLRPAISLLIEVRGVGLGRAHLLRRVHTAVIAGMTAVETAAEQGGALVQLVRTASADIGAQACRGELVVSARHSMTRQRMVFVDAVTGVDKAIEVDWRAAEPLDVQRRRTRPCGYLIAAEQTEALERLRLLGVRMQPVDQATRWSVEGYRVLEESGGRRQDARGAIDDGEGGGIRVLDVALEPEQKVAAPGAWYVDLDQPMGALIAAALEPDSQNSFAANRLLDPARLWRVLQVPPAGAVAPLARP
jgi:Zinc carboxypeptidase